MRNNEQGGFGCVKKLDLAGNGIDWTVGRTMLLGVLYSSIAPVTVG